MAEAMFATANWVCIQARGWMMLLDTRVIYAKKAVPERMMGSFPIALPRMKKKA